MTAPTLRQALQYARQQLQALEQGHFDAEVLLCFVLQKNRAHLIAWPEKPLSADQWQRFQQLIQRRAAGEPVAYLTGRREFWSLDLNVTPDTLIPRPDTEVLVEQALQRIPSDAPWRIADVGTGSGAIALAIASERPACQLYAIDISPGALQVARDNARRLGIKNVTFLQGKWLQPIADKSLEMVLSNPPYIQQDDPHLQQGDVRFEPRSALVAGTDGLDDIRVLCDTARQALKDGGWLLLEHSYHQGSAIVALLKQQGYSEIIDIVDYSGNDRLAIGRN